MPCLASQRRGKGHIAVRDVGLNPCSADPCIGFLRRHDQALHRRSIGRLVLFRDIDRSRFNGLVPSVVTGRKLLGVFVRRPYDQDLETDGSVQMAVCSSSQGSRKKHILYQLEFRKEVFPRVARKYGR